MSRNYLLRKITLWAVLLCTTPFLLAFTLTETDPDLLLGLNKCDEFQLQKQEQGSYLQLPAFPEQKDSALFDMYFWTQKELNPKLPTIVLIPGGPGQTYHQLEWVSPADINIIFFDPRGMGCSTPLTDSLLNSAEFYSSEYVAQDLEALRKHLHLEKWSVYGHSFGTIPATIYASNFPERTRSLILEGTVHQGGEKFWYSSERKNLIMKIWAQLSSANKTQVLATNLSRPQSNTWFSQTLLDNLPQGFDEKHFAERLKRNLAILEKGDIKPNDHEVEDLTPYFSRNAHLILSCKELAADLYSPKRLYHFDGFQLLEYKDLNYQEQCSEWNIKKNIYDHQNYPLLVPTYYLQGEVDYLTLTNDAYTHYLANQTKQKHFLVLKNGGHNPFSLNLNIFNKASPLQPLALKLLNKMIKAQNLEPIDFADFRAVGFYWETKNPNSPKQPLKEKTRKPRIDTQETDSKLTPPL